MPYFQQILDKPKVCNSYIAKGKSYIAKGNSYIAKEINLLIPVLLS